MKEVYKEAKYLAGLFAEDSIAADCCDMMICGGGDIAKKVRKEADEAKCSIGISDEARRYLQTERELYGAFYSLLEGKYGYKLVKINE